MSSITKIDFLEQHLDVIELDFLGDNMGNIFTAMQDYSKQEVIAFISWLYEDVSRFQNSCDESQLYEMYIKSLNK